MKRLFLVLVLICSLLLPACGSSKFDKMDADDLMDYVMDDPFDEGEVGDIEWYLRDSVFVVTGKGEVSYLPAYTSHRGRIKYLVIDEDITAVHFEAGAARDLKAVHLSDGLTEIGQNTFKNCFNLIKIEIPDSVVSIGDHAFFSCTSLESIEIPDSVTYIGPSAFAYCESLEEVEIGDGLTKLESSVFEKCELLKEVDISDSLMEIGKYAFSGCTSLEELEIPDSVTEIGTGAFKDVPHVEYDGPAKDSGDWGAKDLD
ncbi:MAG: leucine-rich repeat domain-containing protein [Ruminococcaceae bacterium]|nr:leucine-rich repeat domain-containing protein [Oscillospiraceae bacterium]